MHKARESFVSALSQKEIESFVNVSKKDKLTTIYDYAERRTQNAERRTQNAERREILSKKDTIHAKTFLSKDDTLGALIAGRERVGSRPEADNPMVMNKIRALAEKQNQ